METLVMEKKEVDALLERVKQLELKVKLTADTLDKLMDQMDNHDHEGNYAEEDHEHEVASHTHSMDFDISFSEYLTTGEPE